MKKLKKKTQGLVKNATPNEYDGIRFRSKLETYTYKMLKENHINAEYEKHKYELLPAFTYLGKKVRPMTYLPDFVGDTFIIECKGYPNDAFPIKKKLFEYYLVSNNINKQYHIVRNQKEVNELINLLKQNEHGTVCKSRRKHSSKT